MISPNEEGILKYKAKKKKRENTAVVRQLIKNISLDFLMFVVSVNF